GGRSGFAGAAAQGGRWAAGARPGGPRSRRRREATPRPPACPGRHTPGGARRLAGADIALEEPQHRRLAAEVGPNRVDRLALVLGQVDVPADLRPESGHDGAANPLVDGGIDRDRGAALVDPAPSTAHHPDLER